jgi:hypothetical protein
MLLPGVSNHDAGVADQQTADQACCSDAELKCQIKCQVLSDCFYLTPRVKIVRRQGRRNKWPRRHALTPIPAPPSFGRGRGPSDLAMNLEQVNL